MLDLVAIAKIAKPRGLKGELVANLLTDFPDRFEGLENVTAVAAGGERRKLRIENAWFQNGRVVLKFEGVDSVEAAEEWRNAEICVTESEAVKLDSEEFYEWQLYGLEVVTIKGDRLGTVREIMRTGGTENLVVAGQTKEFLVPFAASICVEIDLETKRIVIDPPEGLLEF